MLVLGLLFLVIAGSEWLARHTWARQLGTALLVILFGAILANLGLIPTASDNYPLYEGVFTYLAPLAIFYLMMEVRLKDLRKAGLPMLIMFLVGALGTLAGIWVAVTWVIGPDAFGEQTPAIAGMFAGTYIGGAVNFNAVAMAYDVMDQGNLYAGAVAVDNILTTLWMLLTLAIPMLLNRFLPRQKTQSGDGGASGVEEVFVEEQKVGPLGLSVLIGVGALSLMLSDWLAAQSATLGLPIPSILILTTLGLAWAQLPNRLRPEGSRVLALLGLYLFLEVIGAFCDLGALAEIGSLSYTLFIMAGNLLLIHGLIIFGLAIFTKWDWQLVSIASQANVGGSTSALALAKAQDRADLILPAILVGTLGNALGTYLGILMVGFF